MARRKNPEPIITQEAILAMAGQHIQSEIIKLRSFVVFADVILKPRFK